MSLTKYWSPLAAGCLAVASILCVSVRAFADDDAEEGRFRTADGLRLAYQWYSGGKGAKSDCVMLIPNYGSDMSKPGWASLAKALQKQGYSVLLFDLRGHGKNTDSKTMDKPELFCQLSYNKFAGAGMNPNLIKDLRKEKFSPSYYSYLVNDLTAARHFLDQQNDANQCNSGRVFVVAEQGVSPLVMLWLTTEFKRLAFGPKTMFDNPEPISAGQDICGIVFLSWGAAPQAAAAAINVAKNVSKLKEFGSTTDIEIGIRKKVAMAFVYGKEDKASALEARKWLNGFGIVKSEDPELVKYTVEVPGAEKLAGIKLLDILEKSKEKDEKVSYVQNKIIDFFKTIKSKAINGNNWKERKVENLPFIPIPLNDWGLK